MKLMLVIFKSRKKIAEYVFVVCIHIILILVELTMEVKEHLRWDYPALDILVRSKAVVANVM